MGARDMLSVHDRRCHECARPDRRCVAELGTEQGCVLDTLQELAELRESNTKLKRLALRLKTELKEAQARAGA